MRLDGVGLGTDEADLLRLTEVVVDALVLAGQGIAELLQVLRHEAAGLVAGALMHVVFVEIPVEQCLALVLDEFEEPSLHLLQHVEADEDIGLESKFDLLLLHDLPLEHALVGQPLGEEALAEVGVDGVELLPELAEALLEQRVAVVEVLVEEGFERCLLLLAEFGHGVEFMIVFHLAEDLAGGCHVLVDIVEVAEQQLSPTEEVVERLDGAVLHHVLVGAIEQGDELQVVGNAQWRLAFEEVADGDIGRTPERLAQSAEILIHEELGAVVGEHHSHVVELVAELAIEVFGNYLEEWFYSHTCFTLLLYTYQR